ncbi:hypothetical protein ACFFGT_19460 [Mucilaginibacter angelicae]|uniref:DUF4397 domain-containing protein n=1 Tax=Mucilaginibacter angelicae TaxID=869718 RepID=A0ABV6LAE6_9SPHI
MKKIKLLFLIALISQFFFACKKDGELIEAKSYGSFNISSTTTTEVGNLLVDVDGKITDTLKAPSAIKTIKAYIGNRKIKIYQPGKSANPVIDTTLNIKDNKLNLTFLYTGDLKIIGGGYDGSVTPARGNSLVQFVNLENSLPAVVDMKIYELYYSDAGDLLLDETATIKAINKTRFSSYTELPPPKHGDLSTGGYYFELFDPVNNNKLVDFFTDFPSVLFEQSSQQFMPNKVMSLAIAKDPSSGTFTTTIIYETELK